MVHFCGLGSGVEVCGYSMVEETIVPHRGKTTSAAEKRVSGESKFLWWCNPNSAAGKQPWPFRGAFTQTIVPFLTTSLHKQLFVTNKRREVHSLQSLH